MQAPNDPSGATSTTDENMTESQGSGTSETTPLTAAHPSLAPSPSTPDAANVHTEPDSDVSG